MKIELTISKEVKIDPFLEYDGDVDNVIDLCFEISGVFSHYEDDINFIIEGFGEGNWFASLSVEFEIFLEQLPGLINWLFNEDFHGENFVLNFYEQGMERDLDFIIKQKEISVTCYFIDGRVINELILISNFRDSVKLFFNELKLGIMKLMPNLLECETLSSWLLSMEENLKKPNK